MGLGWGALTGAALIPTPTAEELLASRSLCSLYPLPLPLLLTAWAALCLAASKVCWVRLSRVVLCVVWTVFRAVLAIRWVSCSRVSTGLWCSAEGPVFPDPLSPT